MESDISGWFAHLLSFFNEQLNFEGIANVAQLPTRAELLTLLQTYDQPQWYVDAYILERCYTQTDLIYPDHLLENSDWIMICSTPENYQQLQKIADGCFGLAVFYISFRASNELF